MARRSIVYIGEFFASGPPNTAPGASRNSVVLPGYCRGIAGVPPGLKIEGGQQKIKEALLPHATSKSFIRFTEEEKVSDVRGQ